MLAHDVRFRSFKKVYTIRQLQGTPIPCAARSVAPRKELQQAVRLFQRIRVCRLATISASIAAPRARVNPTEDGRRAGRTAPRPNHPASGRPAVARCPASPAPAPRREFQDAPAPPRSLTPTVRSGAHHADRGGPVNTRWQMRLVLTPGLVHRLWQPSLAFCQARGAGLWVSVVSCSSLALNPSHDRLDAPVRSVV